jgi:hypothetical protein
LKVSNSVADAVSRFGASLKQKLSDQGAVGAPEDQIRAPLEALIADIAQILLFKPGDVVAVGESTPNPPDYAVKVSNALVGFIEVKAPGKGADPNRLRDAHDRAQWGKLKSLPNLVYTDGNASRSGATASSMARSFTWRGTSRPPEQSLRRRPACNASFPTF